MRHLMIDLETMGQTSMAAIVQIGACFFDIGNGEKVGRSFEVNVDLQNCLDLGLKADSGAVEFWMRQEKKDFLEGERFDLNTALRSLRDFVFAYKDEKLIVWTHASFDAPILENAYKAVSLAIPFNYRAVMDLRTLYMLADYSPDKKKNGRPHNALSDCVFQAKCVAEAMRKIRVVPE